MVEVSENPRAISREVRGRSDSWSGWSPCTSLGRILKYRVDQFTLLIQERIWNYHRWLTGRIDSLGGVTQILRYKLWRISRLGHVEVPAVTSVACIYARGDRGRT